MIPYDCRKYVLDEFHGHHPGIVKMKELARSYVWWPGIDKDIELAVKGCADCQSVRNSPASAPLHNWELPTGPWQRVHIDFAGPFMNSMFLIVVDAYSKWPEVIPMKSTTAENTVTCLRRIFSRFGMPLHLVSDNGPQMMSEVFQIIHERKWNSALDIICVSSII